MRLGESCPFRRRRGDDLAAPPTASRAVPLRTLLAYGGPTFGIAYLLFFVQFYFLKFSTDVLLLPPATIGVVFALAKLWDAISNPIVGSWSDRTRSRLGRRRPFLFGALPLLVLGFVMLWRPPASLSGIQLVIFSALALFLFHSAFALYTIPHIAMGAELSRDSHERTRLFGARQMSFTVGMLFAFGAIQVAMNSDAPRTATAQIAVPTALLAAVILAWTPLAVRERGYEGASGGQGLAAGFRDVWANAPARTLLIVWLIESAGVGAVGTLAPYIAEYLLLRPDVVGALPASYVVAGIASIPIWVRVSRRFGKRETWLAAMLLAVAAFGGMWSVGPGDLGPIMALLMVAGAAMGCGSVLSASIMADVIDLDERRTGERKEGIYSASLMFAMKIGIAGATALSGFVLDAAGFVPNTVQNAESLFGIRVLFAGVPCAGFLLGALLFWRASFEVGAPGRTASPPAGAA
jgi:GPH family glycoside/pentoside/hexuronide:cation symporter